MEIFGIILALFIGAFLMETFRVPRVEKWCHRNGFMRVDPLSEKNVCQLKQLVEKFGKYYVSKWGFSMAGISSDMAVTIAEHQ